MSNITAYKLDKTSAKSEDGTKVKQYYMINANYFKEIQLNLTNIHCASIKKATTHTATILTKESMELSKNLYMVEILVGINDFHAVFIHENDLSKVRNSFDKHIGKWYYDYDNCIIENVDVENNEIELRFENGFYLHQHIKMGWENE